ncbi:MAG: hypothetical protein J6568_00885 [Snodgrassella sp.]|nr:hypothetical protein [Snodgrassella sp.]
MKKFLIISLGFFPILSIAKAPDCHNWPMNMTEMWMRSAGIVDFKNLNIPKTKITLLASEKKERIYTHKFIILFFMTKMEIFTK